MLVTKNLLIRQVIFLLFLFQIGTGHSQAIPITNYAVNENGQVQLTVASTPNHYYILQIRHHPDSAFVFPVSMTLGKAGLTIIKESMSAYPKAHYQVLEYAIDAPADTDGDGMNDIEEYQNRPLQNPLNAAPTLAAKDGIILIDSFATFKSMSIKKDFIQWSEFLNGKEFVKFMILDGVQPQVFFVNTDTHPLHADFAEALGIAQFGDRIIKGQVIFHPTSISNNGTLGTFAFNYSNGKPKPFEIVQKTQELLAANMPFLQNNLSYFVTENSKDQYEQDRAIYEQSRVAVLLEEDLYQGVNYWGLNPAEGYGFFRQMTLEEIPGPRDIVLYEALPNALPRVGGIITTVIQTPLSHVNLRAIQNNVPNAFIRDPLAIDSIANLLDRYIYFRVEQDRYYIREASLTEVNNWYDELRPKKEQTPLLNLGYENILPLADISFSMYDGFGAKCTNVATMQTFGFPEGTIPNGFGVPFYFYQAFMTYNNFFEEVADMINDPTFLSDRDVRNDRLKAFRKTIKQAEMPAWMMEELAQMQASFPASTSIRCRSSSNNEDLAGFNGAGLYDSKTQHPEEGHIAKSIKQVYASLWNLRAFEERAFHRVNHLSTAMGVLCHPNYSDEKANGVGVSTDPLYNTTQTFYLNTQLGEDLITNPETNSIPEEILLDSELSRAFEYTVLQVSNLVPTGTTILEVGHLEQLRDYLSTIHHEFENLYEAWEAENFAMDIEYKITAANQLIIKQARPWTQYRLSSSTNNIVTPDFNGVLFPNPVFDQVTVQCADCHLEQLFITNLSGQVLLERFIDHFNALPIHLSVRHLPKGLYFVNGYTADNQVVKVGKFVKE